MSKASAVYMPDNLEMFIAEVKDDYDEEELPEGARKLLEWSLGDDPRRSYQVVVVPPQATKQELESVGLLLDEYAHVEQEYGSELEGEEAEVSQDRMNALLGLAGVFRRMAARRSMKARLQSRVKYHGVSYFTEKAPKGCGCGATAFVLQEAGSRDTIVVCQSTGKMIRCSVANVTEEIGGCNGSNHYDSEWVSVLSRQ